MQNMCSMPRPKFVSKSTVGIKTLFKITDASPVKPWISGRYTDQEGHFLPEKGSILDDRYIIEGSLEATGQSAVLIIVKDSYQNMKQFLIKVLHSSYYAVGLKEIATLRKLNKADPACVSHTVKLQNTFVIGDHVCLVFPHLNPKNLNHVVQFSNSKKKLELIRDITFHLLSALAFMKSQQVIHADVKPENILVNQENDFDSLTVVDFGNAIQNQTDELSLYYNKFNVQSLAYRAPEVHLGIPFGQEIDMWSLGCVLVELHTGKPLFIGDNWIQLLQQMELVLGPLPMNIVKQGNYAEEWMKQGKFTEDKIFNQEVSPGQHGAQRLMHALPDLKDYHFSSFLSGLLSYDPAKRLTPWQALQHPFMAKKICLSHFLPDVTCSPSTISKSDYSFTPANPMCIQRAQNGVFENLKEKQLSDKNKVLMLESETVTDEILSDIPSTKLVCNFVSQESDASQSNGEHGASNPFTAAAHTQVSTKDHGDANQVAESYKFKEDSSYQELCSARSTNNVLSQDLTSSQSAFNENANVVSESRPTVNSCSNNKSRDSVFHEKENDKKLKDSEAFGMAEDVEIEEASDIPVTWFESTVNDKSAFHLSKSEKNICITLPASKDDEIVKVESGLGDIIVAKDETPNIGAMSDDTKLKTRRSCTQNVSYGEKILFHFAKASRHNCGKMTNLNAKNRSVQLCRSSNLKIIKNAKQALSVKALNLEKSSNASAKKRKGSRPIISDSEKLRRRSEKRKKALGKSNNSFVGFENPTCDNKSQQSSKLERKIVKKRDGAIVDQHRHHILPLKGKQSMKDTLVHEQPQDNAKSEKRRTKRQPCQRFTMKNQEQFCRQRSCSKNVTYGEKVSNVHLLRGWNFTINEKINQLNSRATNPIVEKKNSSEMKENVSKIDLNSCEAKRTNVRKENKVPDLHNDEKFAMIDCQLAENENCHEHNPFFSTICSGEPKCSSGKLSIKNKNTIDSGFSSQAKSSGTNLKHQKAQDQNTTDPYEFRITPLKEEPKAKRRNQRKSEVRRKLKFLPHNVPRSSQTSLTISGLVEEKSKQMDVDNCCGKDKTSLIKTHHHSKLSQPKSQLNSLQDQQNHGTEMVTASCELEDDKSQKISLSPENSFHNGCDGKAALPIVSVTSTKSRCGQKSLQKDVPDHSTTEESPSLLSENNVSAVELPWNDEYEDISLL